MTGTYIIAEAGVNHNGSVDMAKQLIDVAHDAGANAVKFQSFKASSLVVSQAKMAEYQITNTQTQVSQLELLKKLELSDAQQKTLFEYCKEKGITFISTPFDKQSFFFLAHHLGIDQIKVSSGDLTSAPLLLAIAQTGIRVIISTGMATLQDISQALAVLAFGYLHPAESTPSLAAFEKAYMSAEAQCVLKEKVTILQCTTDYPCAPSDVNLNAMQTIHQAFQLPVGFSDHTDGIHIPVAAVALGATVIEKHFTLDKTLPGPDHQASILPGELKQMIANIRDVEVALGHGLKIPSENELKHKTVARKVMVATKPITPGDKLSPDNIGFKRAGKGLSPLRYWQFLGKSAKQTYEVDEVICE